MEDLKSHPNLSLRILTKKDLPTIRNSLSTSLANDFAPLITLDEIQIVEKLITILHEHAGLDLVEISTFLYQHGEQLAHQIREAKAILPPSNPSVALYMTAQAMLVEAVMLLLQNQIALNEAPPAPPVFATPYSEPKPPRRNSPPPWVEQAERRKPIKLDSQKVDEDYQTLQRILEEFRRARQENRSYRATIKTNYDYSHPERYCDFYLVRELYIEGGSVNINPFERNMEVLKQIHAIVDSIHNLPTTTT